jgi:hypothetical protein
VTQATWVCESCDTNNRAGVRECRRCQRPAPAARPSRPPRQAAGHQQRPQAPHQQAAESPVDPGWAGYIAAPPPGGGAPSYGQPARTGRGPVYAALTMLAVLALGAVTVWQLGSTDAGAVAGRSPVSEGPISEGPISEGPVATDTVERSTGQPPAPTNGDARLSYHEVQGPSGLRLAIPDGWQPRSGPVAGNYQADDPGDSDIFLRFGATPAPGKGLMDYLLGGERGNANIQSGYSRMRLNAVSYLGATEAADWEFTWRIQVIKPIWHSPSAR